MYSLDVNLLKDRPEYKKHKGPKLLRARQPAENLNRLYVAIGAALLLPGLAGGGLLLLQSQNSQLDNKIAGLDSQLSSLGIEEQQIKKMQEETNTIKAQNQALASVFNQIRPWSAMLQDLRDRVPAAVQIQSIKQTVPTAAAQTAAKPAASQTSAPQKGQPNSVGGIEISGMASSFTGVNDFLLTLQQSPFFKPKETKIVTAELVNGPIPASQPGKAVPQPPQFVKYTIQSSLSDIPASELIGDLEREGTLGLVTRIRTLQERGIIQK